MARSKFPERRTASTPRSSEKNSAWKKVGPLKIADAALIGRNAALEKIEEQRIALSPVLRIVEVFQFPTVVALIPRGQHPAHASAKPGLCEASQQAVLPIVVHVTKVLVFQNFSPRSAERCKSGQRQSGVVGLSP